MRTYLIGVLVVAGIVVSGVATVNVLMDPFWIFGKTTFLSEKKYFFDERTQKTNLLANEAIPFDGILIGSSRSTFIDTGRFRTGRIFNYAVANIFASEYPGYVDAATARHEVNTIVLGLDLYATNENHPNHHFRPPEYFLHQALRGKLTNALSIDGLSYAWKTIGCSIGNGCVEYYDRYYTKHMSPPGRMERDIAILRQLHLYDEVLYGDGYQWDKNYGSYLSMLRHRHPGARVIAFTTPISYPLFSLLVKKGRLVEYERMLRVAIREFGGVWDFAGVNTVTTNLDNYADIHHFIPSVGSMIVDRIDGRNAGLPPDFGVFVTEGNVDRHILEIYAQAKKVDDDPIATYEHRVNREVAGQRDP